METQGNTLIINYIDVDVVVSNINEGMTPKDAVEVLFNISPVFKGLVKEVQISAPPSKENKKDVETAIKAIKGYLNI